jgi:UrcA family protein
MDIQTALCRISSNTVFATACMVLSALTPLAAFGDPAAAQTAPALISQVSLSDLNLATPAGIGAAQKRLKRKAEYLCRQLWDDDSTLRRTYEACVTETLANAVQQLKMPIFAAVPPKVEP